MLITWDMLCLGSGLVTSPYQLGAYSSLGDTFIKCIVPEGLTELAENYTRLPLIRFGGRHAVNNRQTHRLEYCEKLAIALYAFVEFLEKIRQRVRPAYDGVVLVAYNEEATPALLQQLERCSLSDRFWRTVAGLGHLNHYIKEVHSDKPHFIVSASSEGGLEKMPLDEAYWCAFQQRISTDLMFCDLRANHCYQILLQLLQKEPSYSNFYRVR